MTSEDRLLLNDLYANAKQLFALVNQLESENARCKNEIEQMQYEIDRLKQEKLELDRKNEHLRIASRLLSGIDENREVKKKIDRLVREIDKCIALLNK